MSSICENLAKKTLMIFCRSIFRGFFVQKTKKMPGHIKKSEGPDPDPSPWLEVSPELKVKLKAKPYDPKKSCW